MTYAVPLPRRREYTPGKGWRELPQQEPEPVPEWERNYVVELPEAIHMPREEFDRISDIFLQAYLEEQLEIRQQEWAHERWLVDHQRRLKQRKERYERTQQLNSRWKICPTCGSRCRKRQ